uniref:Uncharacterized protein n=1 Tax=viral metagenome TaxID=1070528 RepID=A0A6C0D343_9ZZZZ
MAGTGPSDDFIIEIELFPYNIDATKNKNSKGYKVGNINFKQKNITRPFTDMDIANTYIKQTFGLADAFSKPIDTATYKRIIEDLFKSDKTQIIIKPQKFSGGKKAKKHTSRKNIKAKNRKTRKHV